jgi:hypothetical protein
MTNTPWGKSDYSSPLAPGIISYGTPSHGGIHVSPTKNILIPEYMRNKDGWYEEDCEWAKVATVFPDLFSPKDRDLAKNTLKSWLPDAYEKFYGVIIPPGESFAKDQRQFHIDHANDFVVSSASGDWKEGVPKGMVKCHAVKGPVVDGIQVTNDEGVFLVPEKEYQLRGHFGFVIDPEKHQKLSKEV